MNATTAELRMLTLQEVAMLVRTLREWRQWTQETLAEIAKLTVRTVQRVEAGHPSDIHTRRALATAFGLEDPDWLNHPQAVPTHDELKKQQEEFEREHVILDSTEITTGRQLAQLFELATMDMSTPSEEMPDDVMAEFARLLDYLRDFRDVAPECTEVQKLAVYAEVQQHVNAIAAAGYVIFAASRRAKLTNEQWENKTPWDVTMVYLTTASKGRGQRKMAVPRKVQL